MIKIRKGVLLLIAVFFALVCRVNAENYGISFTTDSEDSLKSGDIIEVKAGIACTTDDYEIDRHKFRLIYDSKVFELLDQKNSSFFNEDIGLDYDYANDLFEIRSGWNLYNQSIKEGNIFVILFTDNRNFYITTAEATDNCIDYGNADLITYRFRVKDVSSQTSKIKVIDELDYMEELDLKIENTSANNDTSSTKVSESDSDKIEGLFGDNSIIYVLIGLGVLAISTIIIALIKISKNNKIKKEEVK